MPKRTFAMLLVLAAAAVAHAEVVLTVSARNPSPSEVQTVTVRTHLPKGILPEHIIDPGGMDIVYDEQAGKYMARKEAELPPEGRVTFTIHLEDIWLIDEDEVTALGRRAAEIVAELEGRQFEAQAVRLRDNVSQTVETILARQEDASILKAAIPEHISAYDSNLVLVEITKEGVAQLEQLLSMASDTVIMKHGAVKGEPPDVATLWKVIFLIIAFLAVVTILFFFIWSRQLQRIREAAKLEAS